MILKWSRPSKLSDPRRCHPRATITAVRWLSLFLGRADAAQVETFSQMEAQDKTSNQKTLDRLGVRLELYEPLRV